jgi:hypothetical protein
VGRSIMQGTGLVECCSTALSVAILFGGPLALDDSPAAHTAVLRIANDLKPMMEIATVLSQNQWISQLELKVGQEGATAEKKTRTFAAVVPPTLASTSQTPQTQIASSPPAEALPRASRIPLVWPFDEPRGPSILVFSRSKKAVTGFSISGKNVSDEPLMDVAGTLKPDTGGGEIKLDLSLDSTHASVRMIPPGAQFNLDYTLPRQPQGLSESAFLSKFGGAIFAFHYTHAGAEKTFICYFPATRFKAQMQATLSPE